MINNESNYLSDTERVRRRRRKKKRRNRRIMAYILLFILAVALVGGIIWAIVFFVGKSASISGTYERSVDITSQIVSDMAIRLSDVDKTEIDASWIRERVGTYEVTETLNLQSDKSQGKTFTRAIDTNSYNRLAQTIRSDMGMLITEIIADRLVKEGYQDAVSREQAATITTEVLGMSAQDYLASNGVELAPSIEEITEMVIGAADNQGGSYKVSGGKITLTMNGAEREETVIKKKDVLVFTDSSRVYYEK